MLCRLARTNQATRFRPNSAFHVQRAGPFRAFCLQLKFLVSRCARQIEEGKHRPRTAKKANCSPLHGSGPCSPFPTAGARGSTIMSATSFCEFSIRHSFVLTALSGAASLLGSRNLSSIPDRTDGLFDSIVEHQVRSRCEVLPSSRR